MEIEGIQFTNKSIDNLVRAATTPTFSVNGECNGIVYIKDIDNLILALQKAKELWG